MTTKPDAATAFASLADALDAGTVLHLDLDDHQVAAVLAGLERLNVDPGDSASVDQLRDLAEVQVLDAWIRYQLARQRRARLDRTAADGPDSTESPEQRFAGVEPLCEPADAWAPTP